MNLDLLPHSASLEPVRIEATPTLDRQKEGGGERGRGMRERGKRRPGTCGLDQRRAQMRPAPQWAGLGVASLLEAVRDGLVLSRMASLPPGVGVGA